MKTKVPHLSSRLTAIAAMVNKGYSVCDMGCDHAWLSIYLVQKGISPAVLAIDKREWPLSRARSHIEEYHLTACVRTRLSYGLKEYIPGELGIDATLICAGMGGWLIRDILENDYDKVHDFKDLILSPQSDLPMLRRFLREHNYFIIDENMLLEGGIFYTIIKAVQGNFHCRGLGYQSVEASTDISTHEKVVSIEDVIGPVLLKKRHPLLKLWLKKYIVKQKEIIVKLQENALAGTSFSKRDSLLYQIKILEEILSNW